MASGGGPSKEPVEAECDEFNDEVCFSTVGSLKSEELSVVLPLKSFGRGVSDEGYPLSPEEPSTPRADLLADIKRLEQRIKEILGVLASWANVTESTQNEQQVLSERFEELQRGHEDLKLQYRELARMKERLEDRLKMEKELKKEIDGKVAESVEQEMDRRKSEYLEEIKEVLIKEQERKVEKEVQLHVSKLKTSTLIVEKQIKEVEGALLLAQTERDRVKEKFEVTKAKLQEEENKNAVLLHKIEELEQRCRRLEEENSRLKLLDFVHQTNFILEGPMLECFSCRQEYSSNSNNPEGCSYHPIPSMPYESWRNVISNEELPANLRSPNRASHFRYWACCNVLASRRPEGCCHGRHHQQWEMDIMMRQVLVHGQEHSAFMAPLRIC